MVLADGSLELKLYFDVPVAETDGSDEVRQEPKRSRKGAEKEPKRSRRVPKRSRTSLWEVWGIIEITRWLRVL